MCEEGLKPAERNHPKIPEAMVDLSADVAPSAVQSSLHTDVRALLKEMKSRCASQKGWLRWSLEKKVGIDSSCGVSLICVLVSELEKNLQKIHKIRSHMHVIPVLHTLYYVVMQSGSVIPTSLYQRVYECLRRLLILPLPYSAVALSTLSSIKMEMTTPGSLYQRRVTAEHNLKTKHFTSQEKVFVLADPAVFSAQLEAAVRGYLEMSSLCSDTPTREKSVIVHVLQKGLGAACQSSRLAQALGVFEDQTVERYFEEVVLAVEQSIAHGAGGCTAYLNRLQHIQRDILTAAKEEITEKECGSVCSTAMCFPDIEFILWVNDEDLWNLLANFTLRSCSNSSVDEDEKDKGDASDDSRFQRRQSQSDLADAEQPRGRNPPLAISRRNAYKTRKSADTPSLVREKVDAFPGSSPVPQEDCRCHTARVVVMGDDRALGRLAGAYHSIRERESKRLVLSKKLKLQLYYIPVTEPVSPCQAEGRLSLASLLGRVDPWYNSNINSLRATISNLAGKHCDPGESSEQNLFLLGTMCYYLRCGTQPVHLPLYSVKMTRSSCDVTSVVEEVFVSHLEADIPEFRHLREKFSKKPSARRKKSTVVVYGAVIIVSYTETSLSKRRVVRGEAPMTCGVVITSEPAAVTTGEDYLTVSFDCLDRGYNTNIRSGNISIRTMEHRTLSVCLDRDARRTYTDVQRMEISSCLDPGCSIRSRFNTSDERELPPSRNLNKTLSLPINTFSGVTL